MAAALKERVGHQDISGPAAGLQLHPEIRAERPDCQAGIPRSACCDAACAAIVLPLGGPMAVLSSRGRAGLEAVRIRSGIDREGFSRPPWAGSWSADLVARCS